jgi:hypothetical protein
MTSLGDRLLPLNCGSVSSRCSPRRHRARAAASRAASHPNRNWVAALVFMAGTSPLEPKS